MNILALTSSYPRYDGDPTAPFIESITRQIADLGHEVHLVLPENRSWRRPPEEGGVFYHPFRYSPRSTWTPWGYSESLAGAKIRRELYALAPIVYYSAQRVCRQLVARLRFDVVHAHWVVPNGVVAAHVSSRHGLPLVTSLHGSDVTLAERSGLVGKVARRSLSRASAVTAASKHVFDRATALGVPNHALELVPYGVDVNEFRPDRPDAGLLRRSLGIRDEDVLVLGIGRFVPVKGFEYLIDAVAEARRSDPSVRVVMAGDGELRPDLEARARDRGLQDAATFVGAVERRAVPDYFAAADIVAVPSIVDDAGFVEALGNVALEALASGRPVVASRVGGLPEVVRDGENGVLVEQRDASVLGQAIVALARDEGRRRALGVQARSDAEDSLTWRRCAEHYVAIYERVGAR